MTDSQAQVGNGTGAVLLHQDVLGLQVSMGDAWLSYHDMKENSHLLILSSASNCFVNMKIEPVRASTIFLNFHLLQVRITPPLLQQFMIKQTQQRKMFKDKYR